MRIWFKAFDDSNHLVNDIVVEDNSDSSEKSEDVSVAEDNSSLFFVFPVLFRKCQFSVF